MIVQNWRIFDAPGGKGLAMWFDPSRERPQLRGLTEEERHQYLDTCFSVSAQRTGTGGASQKQLIELVRQDQLSLF